MLTASKASEPDIFGIFELNETGIVLYSRFQVTDRSENESESIIGRNFFDEFSELENCEDIRVRFKDFVRSRQSYKCFYFNCRLETASFDAKVLMTKGRENHSRPSGFVIVDIRKTERNRAFNER